MGRFLQCSTPHPCRSIPVVSVPRGRPAPRLVPVGPRATPVRPRAGPVGSRAARPLRPEPPPPPPRCSLHVAAQFTTWRGRWHCWCSSSSPVPRAPRRGTGSRGRGAGAGEWETGCTIPRPVSSQRRGNLKRCRAPTDGAAQRRNLSQGWAPAIQRQSGEPAQDGAGRQLVGPGPGRRLVVGGPGSEWDSS